jgi:hypothetical protein
MTTFVITPICKTYKPKNSGEPDSRRDFEEQHARVYAGNNWMWDDAAGNESKVGGYFGFVFNGDRIQFHIITGIAEPTERLETWSANVGQGNRKVLYLSKPIYDMDWVEWIEMGGAQKVQGSNYPRSMDLNKLFRLLKER